jgi:formamidopyrimidine-DNA glycosylase
VSALGPEASMPELPEVETVARDLRPRLRGRTIMAVRRGPAGLRRPWDRAWDAALTGARIEGVRRRGKWILIDLAATPPGSPGANPGGLTSPSSPVLRVHLGMTGQLTVAPAGEAEPDHLHLVFPLDDGSELRYRDIRRFGLVEYFPDRAAVEAEMNRQLGPEPFGLDAVAFRTAVTGTVRNLKAVLLDQSVVAGVGNIYADEACFRARLHPGRTGKSLRPEECDRLRTAIEAVLTKAVASRGSTIRDYVGGSGLGGRFQTEFAVYGRAGEPCPVCRTPIACVRLAGRSSHFCPVCQPQDPPRRATGRSVDRAGGRGGSRAVSRASGGVVSRARGGVVSRASGRAAPSRSASRRD